MADVNDSLLDIVWAKAKVVKGYNPDIWRKDFAGAWLLRDQYGLSSEYGWEVCHLVPTSQGGTNDLGNLSPIHWENNRRKSNRYPMFTTIVTADGEKNVRKERIWKVHK